MDRILDCVVVDRGRARVGVTHQCWPALERMLNGFASTAAGGHDLLHAHQPRVQRPQRRLCMLLPHPQAFVGVHVFSLLLNGIQGGDALQCFRSYWAAIGSGGSPVDCIVGQSIAKLQS